MIQSTIYDQYRSATANLSAYIVLGRDGGECAKVTFTYSRTGNRTTCWLHVYGLEMVKAFANGGGYDKHSASVFSAAAKVQTKDDASERSNRVARTFRTFITDTGTHWDRELINAGFRVLQAV